MSNNCNIYQKRAYEFAKYSRPEYPFLALGEEAGEVLGKLAKYVRKNDVATGEAITSAAYGASQGFLEDVKLRADLISELGDVMWQLAACCTELNLTLSELQAVNIEKLKGRDSRGTIVGEGDAR